MIGTSNFDKIIRDNILIIDKTLFIKEFMEDEYEVTCILRPRRFGKSTNISMLKSFLSIGASPTNFTRFLISKEVEFVKKHCGQYPVIFLDLKDCKGNTWEDMYQEIWICIIKIVNRHENELGALAESGRNKIDIDFSDITPPKYFTHILDWLINSLFKFHHKEVIVLIDEYDNPLNSAFQKNYYQKASDFFGKFYSSVLKSNIALERACLMGIVEVRGGGILSGLNNIMFYSVSHECYSDKFGFLENEVKYLILQRTLDKPKDEDIEKLNSDTLKDNEYNENLYSKIASWYNGYDMGPYKLFNPWSIVNYLKNDSYWIKSAFVDVSLSPHTKSILFPILILLNDSTYYSVLPLSTKVYYSSTKWDVTNILHFLVHTGCLSTFSISFRLPWLQSCNGEMLGLYSEHRN